MTVRGTPVSPNRFSIKACTRGVVASRMLYLMLLRARMARTCRQ